MQKLRNQPHNILFTIKQLTDGMGEARFLLQKGITQVGVHQWPSSRMAIRGANAVSPESLSGTRVSYGD
jgi:hypothetical protein